MNQHIGALDPPISRICLTAPHSLVVPISWRFLLGNTFNSFNFTLNVTIIAARVSFVDNVYSGGG